MSHAEQRENLARVGTKIGAVVETFCRKVFGEHRDFFMSELDAYVRERCGGAPDSSSRILRMLRQQKIVHYVVVSRSQSQYRVISVGQDVEPLRVLVEPPSQAS